MTRTRRESAPAGRPSDVQGRYHEAEQRQRYRDVAQAATIQQLSDWHTGFPRCECGTDCATGIWCHWCSSRRFANWHHGPSGETPDGITWHCVLCGRGGTVYRLERLVLASPSALARIDAWLRGAP